MHVLICPVHCPISGHFPSNLVYLQHTLLEGGASRAAITCATTATGSASSTDAATAARVEGEGLDDTLAVYQ